MDLLHRRHGVIEISLSRRNLLQLINLLNREVSMPSLHRRVNDTTTLFVVAQEDEEHYKDRQGREGPPPPPPPKVKLRRRSS